MTTVHQVIPVLAPHDAVGNHTLQVREALRAGGVRVGGVRRASVRRPVGRRPAADATSRSQGDGADLLHLPELHRLVGVEWLLRRSDPLRGELPQHHAGLVLRAVGRPGGREHAPRPHPARVAGPPLRPGAWPTRRSTPPSSTSSATTRWWCRRCCSTSTLGWRRPTRDGGRAPRSHPGRAPLAVRRAAGAQQVPARPHRRLRRLPGAVRPGRAAHADRQRGGGGLQRCAATAWSSDLGLDRRRHLHRRGHATPSWPRTTPTPTSSCASRDTRGSACPLLEAMRHDVPVVALAAGRGARHRRRRGRAPPTTDPPLGRGRGAHAPPRRPAPRAALVAAGRARGGRALAGLRQRRVRRRCPPAALGDRRWLTAPARSRSSPPRFGADVVGGSEAVMREAATRAGRAGLGRRGPDDRGPRPLHLGRRLPARASPRSTASACAASSWCARRVAIPARPIAATSSAASREGVPLDEGQEQAWVNGLFRVPDLYHHLVARAAGYRRDRLLALPLLDDGGGRDGRARALDRDAVPPRRGLRPAAHRRPEPLGASRGPGTSPSPSATWPCSSASIPASGDLTGAGVPVPEAYRARRLPGAPRPAPALRALRRAPRGGQGLARAPPRRSPPPSPGAPTSTS